MKNNKRKPTKQADPKAGLSDEAYDDIIKRFEEQLPDEYSTELSGEIGDEFKEEAHKRVNKNYYKYGKYNKYKDLFSLADECRKRDATELEILADIDNEMEDIYKKRGADGINNLIEIVDHSLKIINDRIEKNNSDKFEWLMEFDDPEYYQWYFELKKDQLITFRSNIGPEEPKGGETPEKEIYLSILDTPEGIRIGKIAFVEYLKRTNGYRTDDKALSEANRIHEKLRGKPVYKNKSSFDVSKSNTDMEKVNKILNSVK